MKGIFWLGILGITSLQILSVNPCFAQSSNIISDDSLGNEASQIEKNSQLQGLPVEIIRGGAQRGINLFHSFREFNVREGRGAYFFSPNAEIQNILTRVTGSNRSEILGTLGTFGNSQPNLFLINPNGILFGENASLDLEGSFVGTTANGVQFGERGVFSATNPEAPALLTVNPSALFFNQINAQASIQNNSVAPAQQSLSGEDASGLRVPDGKSLLLLGGNVSMDGGRLNAYGGRVKLGGLTEPGTVALDINGDNFRLGFPENVKRGDVSLTNEAGIYVASNSGGDILVNAQNLEMRGRSSLSAGIGRGLGSDNSKGGNIDVNATGIVKVQDGAKVSTDTHGRGNGGNLTLYTNKLLIQDGAKVSADTRGKGKGGNLIVDVSDVQLVGNGSSLSASAYATGDGGNLTLYTNKLLVQDGAKVSTDTHKEGKGGDLIVNAQDTQLIGTNEDGNSPSGLSVRTYNSTGDGGNGGNLTLSTNKLLIQDGAKVSTDTHGRGKGGDLTVNAQDVQLIGISKNGNFSSGLSAAANENSIGDGGNLTLSTNKLLIQNGAKVSTDANGSGNGGNLTVNAQDVQLIGISKNGKFSSGLSAAANENSIGDGGNLTLSTNKLLVQDGAKVSTDTHGRGKGGDLNVNAQDVQLIGIRKNDNYLGGLSAAANENSIGDGGNLTLSTNKLLIQDGAKVSADTRGKGKGGNLIVDASDVQLVGNGSSLSASAYATGNGGNLTLYTNKLLIQDGAVVSTDTHKEGKGGDLIVNAQDVQLSEGEDGITGLSARTYENSTGDGGNLTLSTNKLLVQDGAKVSTDTHGRGKGGDLTVKAQDVQLIGTSKNDKYPSGLSATANSKSTRDGGNLTLYTNKLLVQDRAVVSTATFGEGKGGDLTINTGTLQLKDYALITAQSTEFGIFDLVTSANTEANVKGVSGNIEINVKNNFNANNGRVITQSQQSEGGNIKITAGKNIILRNDSNIRTALESSEGSGGNISLTANAIVVLEDSDILAFATEGSGGNITFNTRAFLSNPLYRPTPPTSNKETLDALEGNNRVDINASGSISAGNIIGIPDISFLQDNLTDLPANQIDTNALIANSCIARSTKRQESSFTITGSGGLRNSPVNGFVAKFSTGDVRRAEQVSRPWKKGDTIVEPTGAYRLADGRLILGRACD